ncbi:hypothetical protein C0674_14930 [Sporolactobacillus terrae]|uniref:Uncharacterized protein n=1 Tax=Sporolactobacillus terrae TaxID=269673 RepID=A0ABX5QAT5_9BACL|nr:hypothetical protein C0674_14930 [Sporolactobacillus terrae]QAA26747.1 hypothetical protein C0679_14915 [Sporolactobacillus terrae]
MKADTNLNFIQHIILKQVSQVHILCQKKGVTKLLTDLLITEATKQGLWAILYITLYFYTLREGRRQQTISATREDQLRDEASMLRKECLDREAKLTNFIDNMAKQFERLATQYERIAADVQEIRVDLEHKVDRTELK